MTPSIPVLQWQNNPDGSILAHIDRTAALPFYQIIPVVDEFQLVLVRLVGAELLGTHPTLEAAQAAATTHVGDDE